MATMAGLGVTALIELLPGGTLTGIAKRALPGVELLAIKTPDQLDAARALVAAHGARSQGAGQLGRPEHNGRVEPRQRGGLIVIGTKILGFGGYQPDKVVTNDDLAKIVDTNDEWIRSRVGIQSRRVARDDETVADMAEAAGAKALAASGLEPVGGRPGHRRDLLARVAAAQRGGHRRPPARHPRARRLRPQRGLRRVLLRDRRRLRLGARRVRAERAGDRRGEDDLLDRLDRPVDLHHLRRRRGRGRGRPEPGPASRPGSGRWSGARRATRRARSPSPGGTGR